MALSYASEILTPGQSPPANDGSVVVWDLETGRSLQTFALAASEGISAAVWCPNDCGEPTEAFAVGETVGKVTVYRRLKVRTLVA